jgi:hypothetical protein
MAVWRAPIKQFARSLPIMLRQARSTLAQALISRHPLENTVLDPEDAPDGQDRFLLERQHLTGYTKPRLILEARDAQVKPAAEWLVEQGLAR